MGHVKIITINTWKCDGDYHARMHLLAEQLDTLEPGIVACQECFLSEEGDADTLKFLAGKLNMMYYFVSGRCKKRYFGGKWMDSQSGLGILSAFPITAIKEYDLPGVVEDNDRKVQQAEITLPDGLKLTITNTHLTHLKNAELKLAQADVLAGVVLAQTPGYHMICGDFNSEIDSAAMTAFRDKTKVIDCYAAGNGCEPRYSLTDAYYAHHKKICVDHVFALPVNGKKPQFINAAIVLNTPDATGLFSSDHFGITTTLVTEKQ